MEKKMKKKEKEKGEKRIGEGEKKRGEEEKRRKKKNKSKESSARDAPLPPDAFPSTRLGNNMTPIEGRLGKNTTPACKQLPHVKKKKQHHRPQIFRRIPNKDDQASTIHLTQIPVTHQRKRSIQSISPTAMEPLFIRRSKPSETRANVPNSPSISIKDVRTFSRKSKV